MKKKHILIVLFTIFAIFIILCVCVVMWNKKVSNNFDKELFLSKGYSNDEIMLFCDIGFFYGRIKKWETDVRVEIVDIEKLNQKEIADIDSIINILSPLIYPFKMERVEEKGNLKVHRKVKKIPTFGLKDSEVGLGIALINPLNLKHLKISINIIRADIYVHENSYGTKTLIHEFLHAIGLAHASKPHKFNLVMSTYKAPSIFNSIDEYEEYMENNYYISEQEKQVIKMLYSSGAKSGLKRENFIREMGIDY